GLSSEDGSDGASLVTDQDLQKLLDQLRDLDGRLPKNEGAGPSAEAARANLQRADLLEKIVAKVKAEAREPWVRQVANSQSAAALNDPGWDKAAMTRLLRLESQLTEAVPGSSVAAYVTYREMAADYALKLTTSKPAELTKIQEAWLIGWPSSSRPTPRR